MRKLLLFFILGTLLLAAGALGIRTASPAGQSAQIQPALADLASASPGQIVRIMLQGRGDLAEIAGQVESGGGRVVRELPILNALTVEMPAGAAADLAHLASVNWAVLDSPMIDTGKPGGGGGNGNGNGGGGSPSNYFLETMDVQTAWDMGYTGEGIGVAIVDSGVSPDPDLTNLVQLAFNSNSGTPDDLYGHGTHVSGIVAGNGSDSGGLYEGLAPDVNLFSLKISDEYGMAYESDTVAALQWVLDNKDAYNIRVVNLSIQSASEVSYNESPLAAAAEILWFNGVVVVAATGNWDGGSIYPLNVPPGNDPFIITVGATNEKSDSNERNDATLDSSVWGLTQDGFQKPEIWAPGKDIISVLSQDSSWASEYPERVVAVWSSPQYFRISGTSMSTPMVTGAVALLLQAEPNLTPDQVKYRLMTASNWVSGMPYLNVEKMLTTPTTESANTGTTASQLLWTGSDPINWGSVNWNSVNWNSVNWNSVNWNSVNWNSVNWNAVDWSQ